MKLIKLHIRLLNILYQILTLIIKLQMNNFVVVFSIRNIKFQKKNLKNRPPDYEINLYNTPIIIKLRV